MKIFVFYYKDKALKVLERGDVTPVIAERLKKDGFVKINKEIASESREAAINEFQRLVKEKKISTAEFHKDIKASSLSSILESLFR